MSESSATPSQKILTPREHKIQYEPLGVKKAAKTMSSKPQFRSYRTLSVDPSGHVVVTVPTRSYRAGLRALFNFDPKPVVVRGLAGGEAMRLSVNRAGLSLRASIAKARRNERAE